MIRGYHVTSNDTGGNMVLGIRLGTLQVLGTCSFNEYFLPLLFIFFLTYAISKLLDYISISFFIPLILFLLPLF